MSDCVSKAACRNVCPVLESCKDVMVEMIEERPLLWAAAVLVIGVFLGRHCICRSCCKKKCCRDSQKCEEKKK